MACEPSPPCPACGSQRVAWVFYGLPVSLEELQPDLDAGRIVLGGCCVSESSPQWRCLACGHGWGRDKFFDEMRRLQREEDASRKSVWRRLREWIGRRSVMTEAEWWQCQNQNTLLTFAQDKASARKLRLFVCAVARGDWMWLKEGSREAIEVAERFADGEATADELAAANDAAFDEMQAWGKRYDSQENACTTLALERAWQTTWQDVSKAADLCQSDAVNQRECDWLRDLFGPTLFRSVTIDPGWRTRDVMALAQDIYTERAYDRMGILADALTDAGCDNADVLSHLRGSGPHLRGCFVLDLLLSRE